MKTCGFCEENCGRDYCFTNEEDGDKVEEETEEDLCKLEN